MAPDGAVYVSSEGQHAPVLRVALPDDVRRALTQAATPPPAGTSAPPASRGPGTISREGEELPESASDERPVWPWFLTGLLGLGVVVVLGRALRPR